MKSTQLGYRLRKTEKNHKIPQNPRIFSGVVCVFLLFFCRKTVKSGDQKVRVIFHRAVVFFGDYGDFLRLIVFTFLYLETLMISSREANIKSLWG